MSDLLLHEQVYPGDIIQIKYDTKVKDWFWGMLAVVEEVKDWGVKADIPDVGDGTTKNNIYPLRLEYEDFSIVGQVEYPVCGTDYAKGKRY